MRQVTVSIAEEDLARVRALRIPAREGEEIATMSAIIRHAFTVGLKVLETQRQESAGASPAS
jgi:hypothetical protein